MSFEHRITFLKGKLSFSVKSYLISATYNGGGTWTASSVRVWGLFELENKIKEFIPLTYSPE